jgi:Pyruvate/2-oxoacid:ferredoxin oxidoreductase gamma subunit
MERELILTGIGGQGVQLAAQVLARAATLEGRFVLCLGTYGGSMRGGNTDSSLVFGDGPIAAPPIFASSWSAIAIHHRFFEPIRRKLRPGALLLRNSTLFDAPVDRDAHRVFDVPATEIASRIHSAMGASMVAIGAYAKLTAIVGLDSLVDAMRSSLPPYRQQHADSNAKLLAAGFEVFEKPEFPLWQEAEATV